MSTKPWKWCYLMRKARYQMVDVLSGCDDELCAEYSGKRFIIGPFYFVFARRTHVYHD